MKVSQSKHRVAIDGTGCLLLSKNECDVYFSKEVTRVSLMNFTICRVQRKWHATKAALKFIWGK